MHFIEPAKRMKGQSKYLTARRRERSRPLASMCRGGLRPKRPSLRLYFQQSSIFFKYRQGFCCVNASEWHYGQFSQRPRHLRCAFPSWQRAAGCFLQALLAALLPCGNMLVQPRISTIACRSCVTLDGLREISMRIALTKSACLMTSIRNKRSIRRNNARTKEESWVCLYVPPSAFNRLNVGWLWFNITRGGPRWMLCWRARCHNRHPLRRIFECYGDQAEFAKYGPAWKVGIADTYFVRKAFCERR